jgi:hypothetical protein
VVWGIELGGGMQPTGFIRKWQEGPVDRRDWYFELDYEPGANERGSSEQQIPVALVGPPSCETVNIEYLLDRSDPLFDEVGAKIAHEIGFIISEGGIDGPDDWKRVLRHCGSLANAYSDIHWNAFPSEIDGWSQNFRHALDQPSMFDRLSFPVADLNAHRNWPWGFAYGVYCFVQGNETVYVGRAVGKTLGQRIDAHLHRAEATWLEVLNDPLTRVEVFGFDKEHRFLAAALEVYLIEKLESRPRLNNTVV